MKTPSLKEVKEYFKNAKLVKCASLDGTINRIENIVFKSYELSYNKSLYFKGREEIGCYLWSPKNGFAEIISYKEKTYTLSETFVNELCKEPNIKEAFVREGIITPALSIEERLSILEKNYDSK